MDMFPSLTPGVSARSTGGESGNPRENQDGAKWRLFDRFFEGLVPVTRFWGVATAIVLTGVGVELAFHKHRTGYYLLGCSMFVLIAEITWVATVFLQLCVRHDHRLWKYWTGVTWFSDWKKSLVYAPMSVIPVLRPHGLWLAYLAGGQLLALALCHFLLTFRTKKKTRRRNKGRLLQDADSFESSKFEEITECLDDGLPEPMPGSSHSLSGGLVEREAVLEI